LVGAENGQDDSYGPQKFEYYETEHVPEDLNIVQDPLVRRYHLVRYRCYMICINVQ
jgi:hypothetical protein